MRNISKSLIDGLASEEYRPCVLVKIDDGVNQIYYTTWDCGIAYNGELYHPRGMAFDTIKYGASSVVDNVSMKLDDTDRAIYSFISTQPPGSVETTITIAVLDSYYEILGATDIFIGSISEWSYSPTKLSCKISSIFVQWTKITTHVFSGSCRWTVFKGSECKYAGDENMCDRTYFTCEGFSNEDNFGGFRWTQSLEDKEEIKTYKNPMRWPYGRR